MPGLRAVGVEVDALFDKFVEGTPGAASAGEGYGTEGFEIKHVDEWRQALENHFGVNSQPAGLQLRSLLHYETPVNTPPLEAWTRKAKDPDQVALTWLREGAPLGANQSIPSVGVFPPQGGRPKAETQAGEASRNYSSFTDNTADSEEEMQYITARKVGLCEETHEEPGRELLL